MVFAITAPLYLVTMSRAIGFVDRGELAAVATTLGIAHPTGYPTMTLLGHLATRLLPLPPLIALNVFAALLVAAGAALLVVLFDYVLARLDDPERAEEAAHALPPAGRAALAGLAALAIALTGTWWQQANGFEVYALHALLLPLIVWLFLRAIDGGGRGVGGFGLCLGFALTNHLTTVLLLPGFGVYAMLALGPRRAAGLALRAVPFVLIGLLPYAWLPWRAAQGPRFDWGDPTSFDRFLVHVTGAQYRTWMFASFDTFQRQTVYFFSHLPRELGYAGLLPAALGLAHAVRRAPRLAIFSALLTLTSVIYAGSYSIRDIDPYYLGAYLAIGMWIAIGLARIARLSGTRRAIAAGLGCALLAGALHYRSSDESRNHLAEDLTTNLLTPLPRDAILLTTMWDYGLSPSYYYQAVERLRPDVLVISPDLLRRSWYWTELARRAPELARALEPEARTFLRQVVPYERGVPVDRQALQGTFVALVGALIERGGRPVRTTSEVDTLFTRGWERVPDGLVERLERGSGYVAVDFPSLRFRPFRNRVDPYVATTSWIYASALGARSQYEAEHGHEEPALRYLEYALTFDPGIRARDIPELPYDGRELVAQMVGAFDAIRRATKAAGR